MWTFFCSLCLISAKHLDESEDSATRVLCSMRWSLVPHYHKGSLADYKPILNNCRVETIEEKSTFKVPLRNGKRCVILAEGYVECDSCFFSALFDCSDFLNGRKRY